jgi:predicted SprT family Zn-dependent metalloprotease
MMICIKNIDEEILRRNIDHELLHLILLFNLEYRRSTPTNNNDRKMMCI